MEKHLEVLGRTEARRKGRYGGKAYRGEDVQGEGIKGEGMRDRAVEGRDEQVVAWKGLVPGSSCFVGRGDLTSSAG